MSEEERQWVTTVEAAEATGYHHEHVRKLAREGAVTAQKTRAGYLIYLPSLRAYIENHGYGPHSKPDE